MVANWRDRTCQVEGVRIHSNEIGVASALPPLVMLHGLNDSSLTWGRIATRLCRERLVLLPDLPGHGQSERPDACYELSWYAHLMSAWLQDLGYAQVDLIGHSFGGGVAQMMLLESRALVRRLVLVASGGLGREVAIALRLASIPLLVESFGQRFMAVGTQLALTLARDGRSRADIAALSALNAQQGSARAFARTVRGIINWRGQRHTYHQRIHEVPELPPILVVWGTDDTIIPAFHGKLIADAFEGIKLVLFDRCGHYLHYENPELFVHTLLDFLDGHDLPVPRARANYAPINE